MEKQKEQLVVVTSEFPPAHIYERARKEFGEKVDFEKGTVFTYGWKIHIFDKSRMDTPLFHHESVHCRQQAKFASPDEWWEKYFTDKEFRKEQEVEAYTRQVRAIKKHVKDKNKKVMYVHYICKDISSSMYGNLMTLDEARKLFNNI